MLKEFKQLLWDVTEEEYRKDNAISYSMISRFIKDGYSAIPVIKESINTPSLTLGSALDCLVTEGLDKYKERYYVSECNPVNKTEAVIEEIYKHISDAQNLEDAIIKCGFTRENVLSDIFDSVDFYKGKTAQYKIKVISEKAQYYIDLKEANEHSQTIINEQVDKDTIAMYNSMIMNPLVNDIFFGKHEGTEKFFQAKFRCLIDNVPFRCMFDLLIVKHKDKKIIPVDLKSTSTPPYDFFSSFVKWNYQIQVREYTRILKEVLKGTEFEDYTITDYLYVVVNKNFTSPVVYKIPINHLEGNIEIDGNVMEDPIEKGKLLYKELMRNKDVLMEYPEEINPFKINNLFYNKEIKTLN